MTFDNLKIETDSIDGIYCRWALAWVPNPKEIVTKLYKFLKPKEIEERLTKLNMIRTNLDGLRYNILSNDWALSKNCSVNFIIVAKQN